MRRATRSWASLLKQRRVPPSDSSAGMTFGASGRPPLTYPTLTTAVSSEGTLRETIVCSAMT